MPDWVEKKIAQRGGLARWRIMKKGGHTYRVAVTKKKGPIGGKTIAYRVDAINRRKKHG